MTSPSVEEVRSLYSKAEAAIKLYERIGLDNLTIPLWLQAQMKQNMN